MAHINNSRRAAYGYDQRVEVLGSAGRLTAGNKTPTTVELADAHAVSADKPLRFFLERYAEQLAKMREQVSPEQYRKQTEQLIERDLRAQLPRVHDPPSVDFAGA